ncbi:unnamed protein product [Oikopleura dioica]|uniref:Uncharacterized protein n=1 Tax=Oikopleura dioica TaxID=34765 RepID=E4YLA6_OIKDI|nr:unnamed protein product [Oikopleura dioica]
MKFSALLFSLGSAFPVANYLIAKQLSKNYQAPAFNWPSGLNLNPLTPDHKLFASEVMLPAIIGDKTAGTQKAKMNWYFWMQQNAPTDLTALGNLAMIPLLQGDIKVAPKASDYVFNPSAPKESNSLLGMSNEAFWNAQPMEDVWYPRGDVKSNW